MAVFLRSDFNSSAKPSDGKPAPKNEPKEFAFARDWIKKGGTWQTYQQTALAQGNFGDGVMQMTNAIIAMEAEMKKKKEDYNLQVQTGMRSGFGGLVKTEQKADFGHGRGQRINFLGRPQGRRILTGG